VQADVVRTPARRAEQRLAIHQSRDVSLTFEWDNQQIEESRHNRTHLLRFVLFDRMESLSFSCPESLPSAVRLRTGVNLRIATKRSGGSRFLDDLSYIILHDRQRERKKVISEGGREEKGKKRSATKLPRHKHIPGPRVGRQASGWTESNTPIQRGTEAVPTRRTLNKHREQADSHHNKNDKWPFSAR
jgi:hypothetical protein